MHTCGIATLLLRHSYSPLGVIDYSLFYWGRHARGSSFRCAHTFTLSGAHSQCPTSRAGVSTVQRVILEMRLQRHTQPPRAGHTHVLRPAAPAVIAALQDLVALAADFQRGPQPCCGMVPCWR
jgi:hypothetical protein